MNQQDFFESQRQLGMVWRITSEQQKEERPKAVYHYGPVKKKVRHFEAKRKALVWHFGPTR